MALPNDSPLLDETVLKSDIYQISWDVESTLIAIDWLQPATGATYRDGMTRLLQEAQDHTAQRLFSNTRKLEASSDWNDSLTWVLEEWLPQFSTTSVSAAATVYPADPVGQHMTDKIGRMQVDREILFSCFNDPDVGLSWLRNQPVN
jgi:hypothetical protein